MSQGPHNAGIQVTNDGATILKSIGVDNPAAKVLVGMYYLSLIVLVLLCCSFLISFFSSSLSVLSPSFLPSSFLPAIPRCLSGSR